MNQEGFADRVHLIKRI